MYKISGLRTVQMVQAAYSDTYADLHGSDHLTACFTKPHHILKTTLTSVLSRCLNASLAW